MFHLNKSTPEGTEKGLDYLRQAIEKDPADPLAYGGLALGYAVSAHGPGAPPDASARATAAALKALELDDTVAEAHAALALNKLYEDWDWETAEQSFQRALKLNSSLAPTRAQYSWYLQLFGRTDEALAQMRRVQEVLYVLGSAYAEKGMYEEAIKAHQRAVEVSRSRKSALGRTYAMAGRRDEARQVLAELEADHTPWDTWFIAQIYAVLGEKDEAFRWLEAAFEPPHHHYVPWIRHSPAFKPLHDDPRFGDLLRRMNIPE